MKYIFTMLLLCVAFSMNIASELETDPSFIEFKNRLNSKWKISVKKNILLIERKEPVLVMPYNYSKEESTKPETEKEKLTRLKKFGMKMKPNITYRYQKRWTINDAIQAEIIKEEVETKLISLPDKYKIRHLKENNFGNKGSDFYIPKTKAEKQRVKEYFNEKTKLENKIPKQPDYHLSKFSLFLISKKGVSGEYAEVYPESVLGEFIQVEKLLFKYKVRN